MKRILVLIATLACLLLPATVYAAYNPLGAACGAGGGAGSSAACSSNSTTDPIAGPNGVIEKVTLIIATIAGVAAVIIILIAGLRYITANGDAQRAASARQAILYAAVGLVVIVAASSIITFVIGKI